MLSVSACSSSGRRGAAGRVERRGRHRLDRRDVGVDHAGAGVGEVLAEQGLGRHVHERRVADVGVAVGEGVGRGLEVEVQALRRLRRGEVVVLEDVQRLADRRAARRRRRHAVDVEPAVLDVRRVPLDHLVAGDVVGRHDSRGTRAASAPGSSDRILHDVGDLVGDRDPRRTRRCRCSAICRSVFARSRFLKIEPDLRGVAVREEQLGGVGERREPRLVGERLRRGRSASTVNPFVASRIDGLQHVTERLGAEPVERGLPGRERARHADREARRHGVGERVPDAERRRGDTLPGSTNASLGMAAGAVSRPSIVVTSPVAASKYTKYPPPPMPAL